MVQRRRSEKVGPSTRMLRLSTALDTTLQHAAALADRKKGMLIVRARTSNKEVFG